MSDQPASVTSPILQGFRLLAVGAVVAYVAHLNGVALPFVPAPTPAPAPTPTPDDGGEAPAGDLERLGNQAIRELVARMGQAWITTADEIDAGDLKGEAIFETMSDRLFEALDKSHDKVTDALPNKGDKEISKALRQVGEGINKARFK